jgi:hypothetical protein
MHIHRSGNDSLVQCEDSFDQAMIKLDEVSNLSSGLMGCFYLHAEDAKAHIMANGLGSSSVYLGSLTSKLQELVCIFDEPSVRFACGLYIKIGEGFWMSHSELYTLIDLPEGTENEEPVFVLYEICSIIKSRIRKCRRNVIQKTFSEQYQEEEALKQSGKELKNAGKLFGYAWRVLSDAYEPMQPVDYRTGAWFQDVTDFRLKVDALKKAHYRKKIRGHKDVCGRLIYLVDDVKNVWGDYARLIEAAILKEESAGHERKLRDK